MVELIDHRPLDRLPAERLNQIAGLLKRFGGVVSLENFSQAALEASLETMMTLAPRLKD